MPQQTLKASDLETPVLRKHSPYCEAAGPIVKPGFVAARIRALQGAYSGAHNDGYSHSSMAPRLPKSGSEKRARRRSHYSKPEQESIRSRSGNLEPKCANPASSLVSTDLPSAESRNFRANIQESGFSDIDKYHHHEASEPERAILSPRALAPNLAGLMGTFETFLQSEPLRDDLNTPGLPTSPRRSVADKLTELVDQDHESTRNETQIVQPPISQTRKRRPVYRIQSRSYPSTFMIPRGRSFSYSSHPPDTQIDKKSGIGKVEEDVNDGSASCTDAEAMSVRTTEFSDKGFFASLRAFSPLQRRRRAWTFPHPEGLLEDGRQQDESQTLPSHCNIRNHKSKRESLRIMSSRNALSRISSPFENQDRSEPSGSGSGLVRRHTSMPISHHAKRPASRVNSLFGALWPERWWKFILIDKKATSQETARRNNLLMKKTMHNLREFGIRDKSTPGMFESHPTDVDNRKGDSKSPISTETIKPHSEHFSVEDKKVKDSMDVSARLTYPPLRASVVSGTPESTAQISDPISTSFESAHDTISAQDKNAEISVKVQSNSGESEKASRNFASPIPSEGKPLEMQPIQPEPCADLMGSERDPRQWEQSISSERFSGSSGPRQSSTRSASIKTPPESSHASARWKTKGSERGIRKVQVIVSLDGAEDIFIEAEVQKADVSSFANEWAA